MRVWREGDRIRDESGTGYVDSVPDAAIWNHVNDALTEIARLAAVAEFGGSVLALRREERGNSVLLGAIHATAEAPPSRAGAAGGETP